MLDFFSPLRRNNNLLADICCHFADEYSTGKGDFIYSFIYLFGWYFCLKIPSKNTSYIPMSDSKT